MKETVRRRTFISSLAIGGLLPRESRGQPAWVPVTAKVREAAFLVNADGSESALSSREGYFYRTTDGSDFRYTQRVIGGTPQGPGHAFLRDSTTRASYNLYYGAKKAVAEKWKQATRNQLTEPQ